VECFCIIRDRSFRKVDGTSFVGFESRSVLFRLLLRVWYDLPLDCCRRLAFVCPYRPSIKVITESDSPSFTVDLLFDQIRVAKDL
jgi:hypothetical protein